MPYFKSKHLETKFNNRMQSILKQLKWWIILLLFYFSFISLLSSKHPITHCHSTTLLTDLKEVGCGDG